jgi:hypothetical protein
MSQTKIPKASTALPWWRERIMWLVVGGPSLVVVASFVTLALALIYPDPVLDDHARNAADNAAEQGTAKDALAPGAAINPSLLPAMKARNHAATGGH